MTEAEWLYGDDLQARLHYLGDDFSSRKARLFAAACGRSIKALAANPTAQAFLHLLERIADAPPRIDRRVLYEMYHSRCGQTLPEPGREEVGHLPPGAVEWAFLASPGRVMLRAADVCARAEGWLNRGSPWYDPSRTMDPRLLVAVEEVAFRHFGLLLADIAGNPLTRSSGSRPGGRRMSSGSPAAFTRTKRSTGWPSWPTPSWTPAATTTRCSPTAGTTARTSAAAG
jgi:hypothetical protein